MVACVLYYVLLLVCLYYNIIYIIIYIYSVADLHSYSMSIPICLFFVHRESIYFHYYSLYFILFIQLFNSLITDTDQSLLAVKN